MKKVKLASFVVMTALLSAVSTTLSANQEITTDDGRKVVLKEDGTWVFRSTDRFAKTKDGRRVRLKDDGSWSYAGNAPAVSKEQVRTADIDIKLKKAVIEIHKIKAQKNTRIKTQTVFYLNINLSPLAKQSISIEKGDISMIKVKDNRGENYPVLSIKPHSIVLDPDSDTTLIIRAEKAPSWLDDAKSMEIIFTPGIFGLQESITLSRKISDFEEKEVDGFE